MSKSSIEWTGATWNPIRARNRQTGKVGTHCVKVSPGCALCYAEAHNHRNLPAGSSGLPYTAAGAAQAEYFIDPKILAEPLRRKKPETYFVCSMTDLFLYPPEMVAAVFGVMAACPQHTFQVLTKRPERALEFHEWIAGPGRKHFNIRDTCSEGHSCCQYAGAVLGRTHPQQEREIRYAGGLAWPLANVWQGVSVENRKHGLPRIDILRTIPTALRFLSIEPLLEDLGEIGLTGIDWVIVGGESGHRARPFDLEWARSIIRRCREAHVPVFMKQAGAAAYDLGGDHLCPDGSVPVGCFLDLKHKKGGDLMELPEDLRVREMPGAVPRG